MAYLDRTRRVFLRGAILAAAGTALLVIILYQVGDFGWLEDDAYDARMSLSAKPNTGDPDIVILDVDDPSFNDLKEQFERWPFSRILWSETVKYVSRGKPRAIAFDIMFGGEDSGFEKKDESGNTILKLTGQEIDQEFAANMKAAGNVVIGFTIRAPGKGKMIQPAGLPADSSSTATLLQFGSVLTMACCCAGMATAKLGFA